MTWRTLTASVCILFLTGALAWANVCPMCLTEVPDNERFCARHKAEMLAKKMTSQDEQKVVDETLKARKEYQAKLDALAKFYEARGNAESLQKVQQEIQDFAEARHFDGVPLEDRLTDFRATTPTPEADALLKEADALRKNSGVFHRSQRLRQAAAKYQEILVKYPTSTAVDSAAFGLAEILSHSSVNEPKRAVKFYEIAYLANPETPHDTLYRAAKVSDDQADYEAAARFYWMVASKTGKSPLTRKLAATRLKELQKGGFGASYVVVEEKPIEGTNVKPK